MVSKNQELVLFSAQSSDATGSAVKLTPDIKTGSRLYDIVVSDDLGGGTFSMEISHDDGTTYVDWLLNGAVYTQSVIGFNKEIAANLPVLVRGVLAGSTSPSLTVKLFFRHGVKNN